MTEQEYEKFVEVAFDQIAKYDACLSGDCPHEKQGECFRRFFEAGIKLARENPGPEVLELIETFENGLGGWMSAALSDSHVCTEMKSDINNFFDAVARLQRTE